MELDKREFVMFSFIKLPLPPSKFEFTILEMSLKTFISKCCFMYGVYGRTAIFHLRPLVLTHITNTSIERKIKTKS